MGTSFSHSRDGKQCTRTENYDDGCSRRTVKDIATNRVVSDTVKRGSGHKDWRP